MKRSILIATMLILAAATSTKWAPKLSSEPPNRHSHSVLAPRQEANKVVVLQVDDDTARRDYMRTKLMYSQNILEGLTTDDFREISKAVGELQDVTTGEKWIAVDSDEYRRHTADFEKSLLKLREAAASENIDATALRFHEMSLRCIDCHKHVRKAGYEL